VIDSGLGNDRVSGGAGQDTFIDAGGTDQIVESFASDFGLYGNLLLVGTAGITGSGATRAIGSFTAITAENISVFEQALLSGTFLGERNVFAVGAPGGSVTVNGAATAVTPWKGAAQLGGRGGNDEVVVELSGLHFGSVEVLEGGAVDLGGTDSVTIKGTNGVDAGHVTTGGTIDSVATTVISVTNDSAISGTVTVSPRIESTSLYLYDGADRFAVRKINAPFFVDAGFGNDEILVGSFGNEDDETNTGGVLDLIDAALNIIGGFDTDFVSFDDSGDTTNNSGTLTPTHVTGLGLLAGGVPYTGFEQIAVTLGSGADTFTVVDTIGGVSSVDTGPGGDTIDITTITGSVTVSGNAGADLITIRTTPIGSLLVANGGDDADWFEVVAMNGTVTLNGNNGDDTFEIGSNAHNTARAVDTGGNVDAIVGSLTINGGLPTASDWLYVDETGETDTVDNDGALTATQLSGLGLGVGITYAGIEHLVIRLGSAGTRFDVRSTSADTLLELGGGADTVNVSSTAPGLGGTLNALAGHLTIDGQGGSDVINISDAGDATDNTGDLTFDELTGLGTAGITYVATEFLNIVLGSGGDTFTVHSTHANETTLDAAAGDDKLNIQTVSGHLVVTAGDGADVVRVGTLAPAAGGLVDGIEALLEIEGSSAEDSLFIDDSGDATPNTGRLTSDHVIGLGAAVPIHYTGFEHITIGLGSGADTFTVDSTHTGTSTVNAGPGNDLVFVETISGPTFINGEAGDDITRVNDDILVPSTSNGIGALLTLDGGTGSDLYVINNFGNGDSTIVVHDTGHDGGLNELIINGTAEFDQYLLRHDLVALLNTKVGNAWTHVEKVFYDDQITKGLTINGLGGDDRFALDDNSALTTINGGEGNDLFQVGQLFGSPRSIAIDQSDLSETTRGALSNGITNETTLHGNNGNDKFFIFHNLEDLHAFGDAGDDEFIVRTFVTADEHTTVDAGAGADVVSYILNAPVSIDGGDGFDKLVVIGTEVGDTFLVTANAVYGAGRVVTYTAIEQIDVDGMEGGDLIVVHSTDPNAVTRIFGGLGSDRIEVAGDIPVVNTGTAVVTLPSADHRTQLIQGPLFVFGGIDPEGDRSIPDPVLMPGESSGPLPTLTNPNLDVLEPNQVDKLSVFNTDSATDDEGTLTPTRLIGLNMVGPVTLAGHAFDGGITYVDIEDISVQLGSGSDEFLVEDTHTGTTEVSGGFGNDSFEIRSIVGHTFISGNDGDDTVRVSKDHLLRSIDALLILDGGAGSDHVVVDDGAETENSLGTLTQTTLTGLFMVGRNGLDRVYSLTIGATATAFTVHLGALTRTFAPGISAADLQTGLQSLLFPDDTSCGTNGLSRCSQSAFVWQVGGDYLVGFRGELPGASSPAFSATGTGGTATDLPRMDGINYYGLELLDITLGSGHDRFNVRGTLPVTNLDAGAGDDLVYVSDAADLGNFESAAAIAAATRDLARLHDLVLHGTVTVDDLVFHGSLDRIAGGLSIELGIGSNTLSISDRFDADPDGNVILTSSSLSGLAPATINYLATAGDLGGQGYWTRTADSGLFGRGINIYGGLGGNTYTVTSVHTSAVLPAQFGSTVTSLFLGEGNDSATISVSSLNAKLVVHGQGGNDTVNAGASTIPLLLIGDAGADTLTSGSAQDVLFGDDGRVYYLRPTGATGYDIVLGGAPVNSHLANPSTGAVVAADASFLTAEVVRTASTLIGTGDTLNGGGANDLLFGGAGIDTIHGDGGNDLIFGDFAWVGGTVLAEALPLAQTQPFTFVSSETTDTHAGGDTIYGDAGDDIVLGQQGGDTIYGGTGNDDLIGGHNVAGGLDTGDRIDGGLGNDVIAGDNAVITRRNDTRSPRVRILLGSVIYDGNGNVTATSGNQSSPDGVLTRNITLLDHTQAIQDALAPLFGNDYIAGGGDNDVIFGQLGTDTIQGDGSIDYSAAGCTGVSAVIAADQLLTLCPSFDAAATDGDDYIEGNGGTDLIFGNLGQDDIVGGSSDMFGLTDRTRRPDAGDLLFGGSGTAISRNHLGDESATGHAADADVIAGDNADIFRLVGSNGQFLNFNYDLNGYAGATRRIIARAVSYLDYTPGGPDFNAAQAALDRGAGDLIHGEAGDDVIYGQVGSDAIYGDAQNDNIVGGYGADWISGGAGDDGILGDDGRLFVSRNSSAYGEPLYGIAAIPAAEIDGRISTPGNMQQAIINPNGVLKYTADLTPEGLDASSLNSPSPNVLFTPQFANDVIYGGLGNDWLHGGAGDDAMSGAEAPIESYTFNYNAAGNQVGSLVRSDYTHPFNPGNVLGYSPSKTYQAQYNPNDPLARVSVGGKNWLLNFEASDGLHETFWTSGVDYLTDGNDHVFGDLGNDWLVGGTGRDALWGGWGNDLLQADDNLNTKTPDPNASYEDIAYGGAGLDVLIGNTGGDRLIDWMGEFNSYFVPFNPFGLGTVSRTLQTALPEYLYALSKSEGADQTLRAQHSASAARNGEPFGELGLVLQEDAAWGAQNAGPRDGQAGNFKNNRDIRNTDGVLLFDAAPAWIGAAATPSAAIADVVDASIAAPTQVGKTGRAAMPLTFGGPAGSTAAYVISDGTRSVSGTVSLGNATSVSVLADVSQLADGALSVVVTMTDSLGNVADPVTTQALKDTVGPTGTFVINGGMNVINGMQATNDAFLALGLSFSDAGGSGLSTLEISTDGGATWSLLEDYTDAEAAQLVGADGVFTVAVRVTDAAGNSVVVTQQIRLDRSGPAINETGVTNGAVYDLGQKITLTFSASDADGVKTTTATLDAATALTSGMTILTNMLTAGVHSIVITATDGLGNTATMTVTFTIRVSTGGLQGAVSDGANRNLVDRAMEVQLNNKLQSAQAAINRGDKASARSMLQAFIDQVKSNAGKKIDAGYAAQLIGWASDILSRL